MMKAFQGNDMHCTQEIILFPFETKISHAAILQGKLTPQLLHLIYFISRYVVLFDIAA
jgi:hypothetical protein